MKTAPGELARTEATISALSDPVWKWMQLFNGNKSNFRRINPDVGLLIHLTLAAQLCFEWRTRGSLHWLVGTLCTLLMSLWGRPTCVQVCSPCSRVGRGEGGYKEFASAGMGILLLSLRTKVMIKCRMI